MDKRNIILFGAGFVVGYFIIKMRGNKNSTASINKAFPDTSSQTEPPKVLGGETAEVKETKVAEEPVDPKIEACKEKWLKFSSTVKFTSQEQMQSTYDNYMTTCVAQS
jgi:hypothetical protein